MFVNGKTCRQSKIPTPTGYLINPSKRNHFICSYDSKASFVIDGWYNKQCPSEGDFQPDIELKRALFDAVKHSDVYVWAGDESVHGIEYLAPFSDVKESENQYIEVNEHTSYDPELGQWINYHWNRLSMMQTDDDVIYVFPHSLVYWVTLGMSVSSGLRNAIVHGANVTIDELDERFFCFESDSCDLESVWDDAAESASRSPVLSRKPFTMDMPIQYQGDYPKEYIEAESWINFGPDHQNGEYEAQTFYVPSPVDAKNLKSLLGRQHDNHVAAAYIAKGFSRIGAACSASERLNRQLFVLFLNSKKYQKFAAFVREKEGQYDPDLQEHTFSFREKLIELAPSLFPFTP